MPRFTHGPFYVTGREVDTFVDVNAGDTIRTISSGKVWFSLAGPLLDANGEGLFKPPKGYPARNLRKNSLLCKIGSMYYQGGTDKTFQSDFSGRLFLLTNDGKPDDNRGEWEVRVIHTVP